MKVFEYIYESKGIESFICFFLGLMSTIIVGIIIYLTFGQPLEKEPFKSIPHNQTPITTTRNLVDRP